MEMDAARFAAMVFDSRLFVLYRSKREQGYSRRQVADQLVSRVVGEQRLKEWELHELKIYWRNKIDKAIERNIILWMKDLPRDISTEQIRGIIFGYEDVSPEVFRWQWLLIVRHRLERTFIKDVIED